MKMATTTGDFKTLPVDDHLERVRRVAMAGFRYIDLSFYSIDVKESPFMAENWRDYTASLRALAEELGVTFVQAHLPSFNPLEEETYEDYCRATVRTIEVCGELGIKNAVIHVGWKKGITKEQFFAMNREALKPLFPAMEQCGVYVLIENSTRANMKDMYYFYTGADMKEFIQYVGHPLIGACWDLGHAHIEGHQYQDIIDLGANLRAIHVHDNDGTADSHCALYNGSLNMDEVMTALVDSGYKGYFTFEADGALRYLRKGSSRRVQFERDTRLYNPTLPMYDAMERLLFIIGKECLTAYGLYEE